MTSPLILYSEAKRLPVDFLKKLKVKDKDGLLEIPYFNQEKKYVRSQLRDLSKERTPDQWWSDSDNGILPYGVWRLDEGAYCVLTEGASDTQTFWFHDYRCLGIPGWSSFKPEWAEYLKQYSTLYLCKDNDRQGGGQFVENTIAKLKEGGYQGQILILRAPYGCKDFSDLHVKDPDKFKATFKQLEAEALKGAIEITEAGVEPEAKPPSDKTTEPAAERPTQADILIRLGQQCSFFHDEQTEPWAEIDINGHRENWPLNSKTFRRWLRRQYWQETSRAPNGEAVATAIATLEGKAIFEGPTEKLYNRIAADTGAVYYDMTDDQWTVIEITSDGWKAIKQPPIRFRRYAHQQPQVDPQQGGKLDKLDELVNVKDEEHRLLFKVWLVSCFIDIPHPAPVIHGEQGTAKSTSCKVARRLVDPSYMEVLDFPRDKSELIQQLSHNWFAPYDNIDTLPQWASDTICRAVSGGGHSKRQLYSDDDDVIYSFRRCIALNGINVAATKGDLLDRAILFQLALIPEDKRKSEAQFWADFEAERPKLLGAIFDAVAGAMKIKPSIELKKRPRMADFAEWGEAIAQALGYKAGKFTTAYAANIKSQNREALAASPIAAAVIALMEKGKDWKGTSTELLAELTGRVAEQTAKSRSWPKNPATMTKRLNPLITNLRAAGIQIERGETSAGSEYTILKAANPIATPATNPVSAGQGSGDTSGDSGDSGDREETAKMDVSAAKDQSSGDSGKSGDILPTLPGAVDAQGELVEL